MKIWRIFTIHVVVLMLLVFSVPSLAFGPNGHRIVARIAENHLTPGAKAKIKKITRGRFLAQLATWPDEIRSNPDWNYTKPWHYLSIDDNESFENLKRSKNGDVMEALARFEKTLRNKKVVGKEKWQALAFYIHFMGDIHQPLHVGRRGDLGGNKIQVKWFGHDSNLHKVWDSGMIDNQYLSFREYASFLDHVTPRQIRAWQAASYLDYAKESKNLRPKVYELGKQKSNPPELDYEYSYHKIDILNLRLVQAGIRLAGKLNNIFSSRN